MSDTNDALQRKLNVARAIEVVDEYSAYDAELVLDSIAEVLEKWLASEGHQVDRDEDVFQSLARAGVVTSQLSTSVGDFLGSARLGGYHDAEATEVDWAAADESYQAIIEELANAKF